MSLKETYIQKLVNKQILTEDEKLIYRLALKTWLGCDGCEISRQKLFKREQAAYVETYKHTMQEISSATWAKFFIRSFTSMVQRMILLGEDLTQEEIREEISMILKVATQHKNK